MTCSGLVYYNHMQGRPLVFVDVETTGSGPDTSRILEIGALRVEDGAVVAHMNQVLDPEELVPGWITHLTGIEHAETIGQPLFGEVLPRLKQLFEGAVFVAHNVSFDYSFFGAEFRRAGDRFAMDKLCTVRLSRALYPSERSHKLDEVIRRGGYQVANRHRAYDDAEVLHKFYHDNLLRMGAEQFYVYANRLLQSAPMSTV
jgi:DNA polymerase-3 subunit epsilon